MATNKDRESENSPHHGDDDNFVEPELIEIGDSVEPLEEVRIPPVAGERLSKSETVKPYSLWSQPPTRLREILGIAGLVLVADVTIFRSHGWAGFAAFLFATPWLLTFAAPQRKTGVIFWILMGMSVLLATKMIWYGTGLGVAIGLVLVVAIAMALVGQRPYLIELFVYAFQTIPAGLAGIMFYGYSWRGVGRPVVKFNWLAAILPIIALAVFGSLFVLANPNLLTALEENLELFFTTMNRWMGEFVPTPLEVVFWGFVFWIGTGLLRPLIKEALFFEESTSGQSSDQVESKPAPLYSAYRNTLLAVIVLFAIYLMFEFATLWFRTFPEGFHYSGYAHEGAAWLTVALAVATIVLSVIFRGSMLRDPRFKNLHRLSWLWSAQNLLLALAVYNRLFIYIDFNGMTRMRIIGLFGITAVVIGFVLVIYKIAKHRSFLSLVRNQLTAVALLVFVFALLPLDTIVVTYNVQRIMDGDPAPSVQIVVHPISAEGVALLQPLLDCEDPAIREGVAAMLAKRQAEAESLAASRSKLGWTTFQWADRLSLRELQDNSERWAEFQEDKKQAEALHRFHRYVYQWY